MTDSVLIIEDNQDLAKLVAMHIQDLGLQSECVHDGTTGLARAQDAGFALVILDIMLPNLDGLEICKQLRASNNFVPVIMLTSRDSEIDRVLGLEIGADDYLTKPFSIRELQARVKAQLRRTTTFSNNAVNSSVAAQGAATALTIGDITIDEAKRRVTVRSKSVDLTAKEFELLCYLAQRPGQVFSRAQLLDLIWGYSHEGYEHTVNSHINRLRNKIELDPSKPEFVLTVWGVGYKFVD